MSDKAKIFIKYDVELDKYGDMVRCKGVIANTYNGFDFEGFVRRNTIGLLKFLNSWTTWKYIEPWSYTYQCFRRTFDVDFLRYNLTVSHDNLEYAVKKCFVDGDTSWSFNKLLQFADTDFGEFYVDISGKCPDELNIKYCYYLDNETEDFLYDAKKYLEVYNKRFDKQEYCMETEEALGIFGELIKEYDIKLMTHSELEEIWKTDYVTFLDEYIPKPKEEPVIEYDSEGYVINVEDLDLSVRTYNALKKAGISTVKEIRKLSRQQLRSICDLSPKSCDELLDKIESTRKK